MPHDIKGNQIKNTKGKNAAEMGAHIGSASLVMIFAVLCLTVFAVLSFETAAYEQKLAHKAADAAGAYYIADGIAEERYLAICTLLKTTQNPEEAYEALAAQGVAVERGADGCSLHYSVSIDAMQELQVTLSVQSDGTVRVLQWQTAAAVPWEYEENLQVWDGETDEAE